MRNGPTFYYPARLISFHKPDRWEVKWWRGNIFEPRAEGTIEERAVIPQTEMVDDLWKRKERRRKIRVSNAAVIGCEA